MSHALVVFPAVVLAVACGTTTADPFAGDGCNGARHQVASYVGRSDVLGYLQTPANDDGDGPGLIEIGGGSDSTCQYAPAASNHETLTLVFTAAAPDSIAVSGGSQFFTSYSNPAGTFTQTKVTSGDSTIYTLSANGPVNTLAMFIGAQLHFPPQGGGFENDIAFAATFIRRITFTFDYEAP